MTTTKPRRRALLAVLVVAALAAALRYWVLGWGLPALYNPDETPILNRALAFAKGDPNPHNFLYPTLYFYALFAWEALYFVVARIAGVYRSLADFQNAFFLDPSRLIFAGRALTAAFGVLTIGAVYTAGARLYDRTVGLGAALFLAVAPFAVRDAHYVKLDVPTAFFVAVTYAVLARIVTDADAAQRRRTWLLAGFVAGLSMASHYYALFIVVPIAILPFAVMPPAEREPRRWSKAAGLLAVAAAGTIAGFVAGCPFFFVEPRTALRDIVGVREVDIDRAVSGGGGAFPSALAYLRMLATDAIGWPVFAASLVGVTTSGWRRNWLLLSFPLAFLAFVSHTVPESRYLNVVLPVAAVAGAAGLVWLLRRVRVSSAGATTVVFALAALPGLAGSIQSDRFFRQDDTRTIAEEYLIAHVPAGATVLVQPYSVPLHRSRESIVEALRLHLGAEQRASIKFQLQLAVTPYPAPAYRLIYLGDGGEDPDKIYVSPRAFGDGTLAPLHRLGVDYVVLKRYNAENPVLVPLESALRQHARLAATVTPYRADTSAGEQAATAPFLHNTAARIQPALERPGPIIDIWQLK
jgi:hypothetical protein